jgi:hypothetical protein
LNNDVVTDIGVDTNGKVYVCGWFSGSATFSSLPVVNSGNDYDLDMFVAKIDPTGTPNADLISQPSTSYIQCYPNPFSSSVHIRLQQKAPGVITIYNIKGQMVWSMTLNRADDYTTWDGRTNTGQICSPGVYLVEYLNSSDQREVKSIVLIR